MLKKCLHHWLANVANFALWYRSLVPAKYKLLLYKDSLDHKPIELIEGITVDDIVNGFDIPFDLFFEE